jgi:energy-coupling factor transport system permease protein
MKNLNPTVKAFTSLFVALVISFQDNLFLNCVLGILCFCIVFWYVAFKRFLFLLFWISLSALGLFFTGMLYQKAGGGSAIIYGLRLASRLYGFAGLGLLFSTTTEIKTFIYSLEQQVHLSPTFAYGILAAFHMLPILPNELRNIKNSCASRGIPVSVFSVKLLFPLLVKSIRWSENLAWAMESKGFDATAKRTQTVTLRVRFPDYVYAFTLIGLSLWLTFWRVAS